MEKRTKILISFIAVAAVVLIGFLIVKVAEPAPANPFLRSAIIDLSETIDMTDSDPDAIIPAGPENGEIPDKIIGAEAAPIKIYEYADYACTHCAEQITTLEKLVASYDGQVAVVFREFVLSFPNSVIAAAAANAAFIQGYWEPYKTLLFANQAEWYYLKGDARTSYFTNLFNTVSAGQGDLEKFQADLESAAVRQRLAFSYGLGKKVDLEGTPLYRLNGEAVLLTDLPEKLDELLKK